MLHSLLSKCQELAFTIDGLGKVTCWRGIGADYVAQCKVGVLDVDLVDVVIVVIESAGGGCARGRSAASPILNRKTSQEKL